MHAVTVISHQWLGHKGRSQPMGMGYIVDTVFVNLGLVSLGHQSVKSHTDLALSRSANLMVVHFYPEAHVLHGKTHARAHIL